MRIGTGLLGVWGLIGFSIGGISAELKVPHQFKPGEIISADAINEVNTRIKQSFDTPDSAGLVGTWSCTSIVRGNLEGLTTGWLKHTSKLYYFLNGSIEFRNNGNGTYSFTTSSPNLFSSEDPDPLVSEYAVFNGIFIYGGSFYYYAIRYTSPDRVVLTELSTSVPLGAMALMCDKQLGLPENPTELSATRKGLEVTLTWKDNSADENEFKIIRRDNLLSESYVEIATVVKDETTYVDNVSKKGIYWYRVKASNAKGDSIGSNLIRVLLLD